MADASAIRRLSVSRSACPLMQWDVWGDSKDFVDFAAERLGGPLPDEVGLMAVLGAMTVLKVSPRRFWLLAQACNELPKGFSNDLGAELDLSEGRERIDVRTPHLQDLVAKCLPIDWGQTLDRASFTQMHRIPILFSRTSEEEGMFVVPRTFAQSVVDWLEDCL